MNFTNGRCPSRYRSTEAYKYQECFEFKLLKGPNLNSNRTSDKHPPQEQGSNGIAVVIAMIMILIVLPICVFVGFMIYHVNYHHRSINEALGKLPFCGSRISKLNCFSSTQNKDQVDAKTPEQMKLLEGQSERKDQEDEQRKAMFSEISKLKDVFVTEEEKLISEEEVKILAPKLQVLVERLEKLRPVSVPEIILINLKKINSLLHALSPHKPTKTIASKYVKKVTDFTKTLEQIEEEVQKEFQKLAEVVQIKDVYLTVHKEWSFGERVNDFERKITKLEEMNESNC